MKILFTHSYFREFDPKQVEHGQPYPPYGTILAASLLRENGYEVSLFDTMFCKDPSEIIPILNSEKPDVLVIYDDGFNYLTKMCLSNMREAVFKMQKMAAVHNCKVVVTSSDSSDHYEKYIQEGADVVILGEAEFALLDLMNLYKSGSNDPAEIKNLAYKAANEIKLNAKRAVAKDLDALPMAAWDLIDIKPYKEIWIKKQGYFSLNIATTRGCPYKCNWCAKPIYGNAYHMRSAESVVKELRRMKELFAFDHIWFSDDIFGLKRSWVSDFAKLLKERGLKLKYKIQSRADLLVQDKYIEDLAVSGCADVWMGAESGSQKILDAMDKEITIEEIKKARLLLKNKGIKASFFIQFGYPGETMGDIKSTLSLIEECMPDDLGISVSYPLPGTVFYDRVKHELVEKTNWTDSDEMKLMFKNTYSPEFYKQLYHYVHQYYRKLKAKQRIKSFNDISAIKKLLAYPMYINAEKSSLKKLRSTEADAGSSF